MTHDEFPPLTQEAGAVIDAAMLDTSKPYWTRRFAAAVIREAMRQAARGDGLAWTNLHLIADNLHALPPPPPTREEMESALNEVVGIFVKNLEYKRNSPIEGYVQTLKAGIAHHCKEQP